MKRVLALIAAVSLVGLFAVLLSSWAVRSTQAGSITENEKALVGTMRSLIKAQDSFFYCNIVDQDADGMGEFGWLGEMAGVDSVRVSHLRMNTSPFIAYNLGKKDEGGRVRWNGYFVRMFLPSASGPALGEQKWRGDTKVAHKNADPQEVRWACYAWPIRPGSSGRRTFFASQEGFVYATDGKLQQYGGVGSAPAPDAVFLKGAAGASNLDAPVAYAGSGRTASDGNVWRTVVGPIERFGPLNNTKRR